jgi:hypothetical protein
MIQSTKEIRNAEKQIRIDLYKKAFDDDSEFSEKLVASMLESILDSNPEKIMEACYDASKLGK